MKLEAFPSKVDCFVHVYLCDRPLIRISHHSLASNGAHSLLANALDDGTIMNVSQATIVCGSEAMIKVLEVVKKAAISLVQGREARNE